MTTQEQIERREYYRIHDRIALQITTDDTDFVNESALFDLLNELYLLEHDAQPLLRAIGEQQRTLLSYLKITNKRIDLLAQAFAQNLIKDFSHPQDVTLSEGGMSFYSQTHLEIGTRVYLKMLLPPNAFALQLTGTIVRNKVKNDCRVKTAISFIELTEYQRQILARHIIQKQAQERRQALQNKETPNA